MALIDDILGRLRNVDPTAPGSYARYGVSPQEKYQQAVALGGNKANLDPAFREGSAYLAERNRPGTGAAGLNVRRGILGLFGQPEGADLESAGARGIERARAENSKITPAERLIYASGIGQLTGMNPIRALLAALSRQ